MKGVTVIDHPLAQARLLELRDAGTNTDSFRRALGQLGLLLLQEATRHLKVKTRRVRTPLAVTSMDTPARPVLLVPILRAGQGLVAVADHVVPGATHGYLGMARDEDSLKPEVYLEKLPPRLGRYDIIVCDPMLATGGSAVAAGRLLRQKGGKYLRFVHALAAPEGVRALRKAVPEAAIFTASLDQGLNENGFIVPGLGDAGDRCFGC